MNALSKRLTLFIVTQSASYVIEINLGGGYDSTHAECETDPTQPTKK